MKSKVFTVYDVKVEAYLQPFFAQNRAHAMRMFGDTVADPKTQFNRHPDDFTLFEIGEWDDETGILSMSDVKNPLGLAREFLRVQ